MIDEFAKEYLNDALRWGRASLLGKLDGPSEYDVRCPLTKTGTNLLGLVEHLTHSEARYFGVIFDRPYPELPPRAARRSSRVRFNPSSEHDDADWATHRAKIEKAAQAVQSDD